MDLETHSHPCRQRKLAVSENISAAAEYVWETCQTWLEAMLHPVEFINHLLDTQEVGGPQVDLRRIWLATFAVITLIRLPFLHMVGIGLSPDFYASDLFLSLCTELTNVVVVHGLLKVLTGQSNFQNTLAIYTVQFIYSPFATVNGAPALYLVLHSLQLSKHANLGPLEAYMHLFATVSQTVPGVWQKIMSIGQAVLGLACMASTAVFAECLAQRYETGRWRNYLAVSLGMILAAPLAFGLWGSLQWFTWYSYIR
jgi:hypothetical protein